MTLAIRRRDLLKSVGCGFGYLALASLAAEQAAAGTGAINPLVPRSPHFPAKAKRVIFLFMQGGVSQVDSFDHKPRLIRDHGKSLSFDDARAIASGTLRFCNRFFSLHRAILPQVALQSEYAATIICRV